MKLMRHAGGLSRLLDPGYQSWKGRADCSINPEDGKIEEEVESRCGMLNRRPEKWVVV